ncbi:MAG: hypothetical protein LBD67_04925 [Candidatus Accumulibacter sp.]|jgi:hypothetical protein|nr:hypothetical protein [Accumulibacter sp.]
MNKLSFGLIKKDGKLYRAWGKQAPKLKADAFRLTRGSSAGMLIYWNGKTLVE